MEQITHIEVVLGDWQQLPETLLALSDDWKYVPGGIYTIVHADLSRALTGGEETLLTRLQQQDAIIVASARTREVPSQEASKERLPDWVEP